MTIPPTGSARADDPNDATCATTPPRVVPWVPREFVAVAVNFLPDPCSNDLEYHYDRPDKTEPVATIRDSTVCGRRVDRKFRQ